MKEDEKVRKNWKKEGKEDGEEERDKDKEQNRRGTIKRHVVNG